jgi:hypothetical protein
VRESRSPCWLPATKRRLIRSDREGTPFTSTARGAIVGWWFWRVRAARDSCSARKYTAPNAPRHPSRMKSAGAEHRPRCRNGQQRCRSGPVCICSHGVEPCEVSRERAGGKLFGMLADASFRFLAKSLRRYRLSIDPRCLDVFVGERGVTRHDCVMHPEVRVCRWARRIARRRPFAIHGTGGCGRRQFGGRIHAGTKIHPPVVRRIPGRLTLARCCARGRRDHR